MKKLPLGITTFADIRDPIENYLYIDKTALAQQLVESGRYYFLSRPRCFGKSLFIDTLSDLFQGKKALFEGLVVYSQWDWDTHYPVINISLNSGDFSTKESISESILDSLDRIKTQHQVVCKKDKLVFSCFNELIENIYQKYQQKVVILIDEYDKPILSNITDKKQALVARELLKTFIA